MLRGMGFTKNTSIFLASGKIYNAEKTMAPLLQMFPNLHTKETLASEEELAPFKVITFVLLCYSTTPLIYTMILTWDTSRIILPGWLLLITQFVFTVRCLSQLREATSLIFCWVTEDSCMVDMLKQLSQISGSWHYCLIIPILGMLHIGIFYFVKFYEDRMN